MNLPDLRDGEEEGKCCVCGQSSKKVCAPCRKAVYCSPDHQREHWGQHGAHCPPYLVLRNDKVGRHGVAARTLDAGETVVSEVPFVTGPKVDSCPLCLGCYLPVDASVLCSSCGWPVCGPECEVTPSHALFECEIFREAGVRFQPVPDPEAVCPQFECITPLRLLLAKEKDPERWKCQVEIMESHDEERKQSRGWQLNDVNVVRFLRTACKLADRFSEELIHTACGILEVNCFEIQCPNGSTIRGLYPNSAIMSHSCVANITNSISLLGEMGDLYRQTLRTTVRVDKGQELLVSYTHSLEPTLVRRELLKKAKYFECDCARCADPTELGTHMSTLKCSKCDNGWVMSTKPLDAEAAWKCTICEFTTRGEAIRKVFAIIQKELDAVEASTGFDGTGIEAREQLMRKYRSVLHPRNAFFTGLRYSLAQMYGRAEGYQLDDLPDIILERKIELCRDLLAVVDVVKPGRTRLKGMTLYELHAPMMILARSHLQQGLLDERGLRGKLEEAAAVLEEAAAILTLDDPSTMEGTVGVIAQRSLEQLRASIDILPK